MTKRDCIETLAFSKEEMQYITDLGLKIKAAIANGYYPPLLKGKSLGMIFDQSSTRTRCSAEAAMTELGGHALYLAPGQIQLGENGHKNLEDTSRVLGDLLDIIGVRISSQEAIKSIALSSRAPVVSFMSDDDHPTQALGDLMTIEENMPAGKNIEDVKLVFVGDTTQITLSALSLCAQMGMNFAQYAPKEKQISTAILNQAKKIAVKSGATIELSDQDDILQGADFVYTDVWYGSYEDELTKEEYLKIFYPKYQINEKLLAKTHNTNVKFMHCLPANREEEVSTAVLEGKHSIAWEQSANKKAIMRAIFAYLLKPNMKQTSISLIKHYDDELNCLFEKRSS
ncbi:MULTISPECIES: ornithine carbamoyltransferase [unclassified Lactobacillus]|uniref:ornithine carbamoyltransferase n=1 Tax=unclassified Lactobacillus TaxID=2620435 RepID=UPI0022699DA0|nr:MULTISPECIES: ornithine carbamoyltransferase [unclassified Lactobacillus]MCX8722307.1 ornithine carbamoyltransferase [Lactobacillus sp. B4010]MCX8732331.1 ornithine carbamoyltransferase [Lactobacillus sp. B4015]MCX8734474.1 ornithine carbamoyltransferase [Lactobacillus sp. B4012]